MSAMSVAVFCYVQRRLREVDDYFRRKKVNAEVKRAYFKAEEIKPKPKEYLVLNQLRRTKKTDNPFDKRITYEMAVNVQGKYVEYLIGEDKNNMTCKCSCEIEVFLRTTESVTEDVKED